MAQYGKTLISISQHFSANIKKILILETGEDWALGYNSVKF